MLEAAARAVGIELARPGAHRDGEPFAATLRVEGRTVVLELPGRTEPPAVRTFSETASPDAFAMRVVEALRAELIALDAEQPQIDAEKRNAGAPAPAPDAPLSTEDRGDPTDVVDRGQMRRIGRRWLWAETGLALTAASGSMGGTLQAALGARIEPSAPVTFGAFALLPLTENNLSAAEGSADVLVNLFGARAAYRFTESDSRLKGELGIGGGAVVLAMDAEAVPPYEGREVRLTAGIAFVHGGLGYALADWLALRGAFSFGTSAPRPVMEFDGRPVAAWGRTMGTLLVGLDFGIGKHAPEGGSP
jgi:hypothetical protein